MRTRMQKLRVALLAVSTLGAAVLFYAANPAHADVDSVAGSAFGASITSTLLGTVLAPSPPGIAGMASEPADGYGPINASSCPLPVPATTVCVQLPGVVSLGVINAATQGAGLAGDNHLGFATSSASVSDIAVGTVGSGLFAQAVSSTCTADGNGARGSTQVLGGNLGGSPIAQAPAAGTTLSVPGVLNVILNEQLPIPPAMSINSVGSAGIIVNGAHITLLPTLGGLTGTVDIILAQSVCAAVGSDVNVVQATTTTTSTTTSTTSSTSSTSTTLGTGTTTTTLGTGTTTTTVTPGTSGGGAGFNACNAGNGGNGGAGTGTGGSASANGGTATGANGGTATGGAGSGTGGAAGNGGNACNGTGIIPIGGFGGIPIGGGININICNAGDGGNGGAGSGAGGSAAANGGAAAGGSASGGGGSGTGGAGGRGGDACTFTIAAATTIPFHPGGPIVVSGPPTVVTSVLARTGSHLGPIALMAIVLTVLGMLMYFGSQGLPDPAARLFVSHPMFRPPAAGGSRVAPTGASRLDAVALDAFVHMGDAEGDGDQPPAQGRGGWHRRWFTQRPW